MTYVCNIHMIYDHRSLTFSSLLHVGAVVRPCQHGHGVAAVLGGEAVLKSPRDRVVEHVEGKLGKQTTTNIFNGNLGSSEPCSL